METSPSLLDALKDRGLRMTEQRKTVIDVLERAEDHLDAEEVFNRARKLDPAIHRATVYRTLNLLKKMGLIDELDLMHVAGDRHYYEIRPSVFHIHLVCTECGAVEEPGGPFWEELKAKVRRDTGFKPDAARMEMGGKCKNCQA